MIALDTNVLLRFLVEDDPHQPEVAADLMSRLTEDEPGFVCREVVLELAWVLERTYRVSRSRIARVLGSLAATNTIVIETADDVAAAVAAWREGGAGLGDLMVAAAARRAGARTLVTFDRKAARIPGVSLLE
ncbi:MAG: type II toxin-antitoxin system VapC family toxin [Amaricoccus sp.]